MTPDELLFALAPDARAVKAARESMRAFTDLRRSADGAYLHGRCQGSDPDPYTVLAHRADAVRCECDCGSYKYPCKHALALVALEAEHPERFAAFAPSPSQKTRLAAVAAIDLPAPPAAPSSAGEALLQAIFADPRDDAARLIYADWLTDHGTPADHDLADFIRVSTRILHEGPQPTLVAEQGRLWAARKGEWLAAVPESLRPKLNARGGVFNHATLTWTQLRRYGEEFAGLFPIDSLDVGGKLDLRTAGQVGVLKLWQRVRWLTLRDTPGVPLPALEMVFRSHYLSAVRDLTFLRGDLTAHEGRVLAGWRDRGKLEALTLHDTPLSGGAADALADAFGPTLKRLSVPASGVDAATRRALVRGFGERVSFV